MSIERMKLPVFIKDVLLMSKTERNGILVLFFILIMLIVVRFSLPLLLNDTDKELYDIEAKIAMLENQRDSIMRSYQVASLSSTSIPIKNYQNNYEQNRNNTKEEIPTSLPVVFDPNKANLNTLLQNGFSKRDAHTILNFRKKGGKFYNPSDLKKIYGIDTVLLGAIQQYIHIEKKSEEKRDFVEKQKLILEINSADSAQFTQLSGIGPTYAARICKFRTYLGGFISTDQIAEVYGLPQETYQRIRSSLVVDTTKVQHINLNFSDVNELKRHPYCDFNTAQKIIQYRAKSGCLRTVNELKTGGVIEQMAYDKLAPYLCVN